MALRGPERFREDLRDLPDAVRNQSEREEAFSRGDEALLEWTRSLYERYSPGRLMPLEEAWRRSSELQAMSPEELQARALSARRSLVEYMETSGEAPELSVYRALEAAIARRELDMTLRADFDKIRLEREAGAALELGAASLEGR